MRKKRKLAFQFMLQYFNYLIQISKFALCSVYNFSSVILDHLFSPGIKLCLGMVGILKELSGFGEAS